MEGEYCFEIDEEIRDYMEEYDLDEDDAEKLRELVDDYGFDPDIAVELIDCL